MMLKLTANSGTLRYAVNIDTVSPALGTMSNYALGDTITLGNPAIIFLTPPIATVTGVSAGAVTTFEIIDPGIAAGEAPAHNITLTQTSTSGAGTGFAVVVNFGPISSRASFTGGAGVVSIQSTTITLTAAQITNSFTTPIPIVSGIPGRTIVCLANYYQYNHNTVDPTSGNHFYIEYTGDTNNNYIYQAIAWNHFVSGSYLSTAQASTVTGLSLTSLINVGLTLGTFTSNPDGNGTFTITLIYAAI